MSFSKVSLKGVKGVGAVELLLDPRKKVHAFIGQNGVGKTKLLESLFQILLSSHSVLKSIDYIPYQQGTFVLASAIIDATHFTFPKVYYTSHQLFNDNPHNTHKLPVIYLASQNRGFIQHQQQAIQPIGSFSERKHRYIHSLFQGMKDNFSNLNMDNNIEQWFITRAQSSNNYQKQEDNRVSELKTVLKLSHQLDDRIDSKFLEISGDNRVSLLIDGEKRQLSQLSTGFTSVLKIIQTIISGFGNFTNERDLQNVKGYVLIDEIETHLHISWQSKIIPLLKELFPNTFFYVTTHSSIVLTQLEDGEAYSLKRDPEGIVRSHPIAAPGKAALVDVLKNAFNVDLNKMKHERMSASQQADAKKKLLDLLD